jgi:ferricrocin synthase
VSENICLQIVLRPEATRAPTNQQALPGGPFDEWFWQEESSRISKDINSDFTTPLYRVNFYERETEKFMVISINHTLYDGNAMPLIINEFEAMYHQVTPSEEPVRLSDVLDTIPRPSQDELESFWKSRFEGVDLRTLPIRKPQPGSQATQRSEVLDVSLGDIQDITSRIHVNLQSLLSVAFACAGRDLFGWVDDAIFGVDTSNLLTSRQPNVTFERWLGRGAQFLLIELRMPSVR